MGEEIGASAYLCVRELTLVCLYLYGPGDAVCAEILQIRELDDTVEEKIKRDTAALSAPD